MRAVLFYVTPTFRLTGSTINAIEYFMAAYEYNKSVKLILVNGNKKFKMALQKLIYDRYDIEGFTDCLHNIVYIPRSKLPAQSFNTILILDYMTINKVKGILRAKQIFVISEKYTDNPEYFLSKDLYNVEYYGEMPFHYKDHDYRMKCLFSRYKPLKNVKKGTYINSPYNNTPERDLSFQFKLPAPFIYKSKTNPKDNLFEQFTHYVYYHANKWFDPHPRLFLECRFYEKAIYYVNDHSLKDGSWYRYNDILKNDLWRRKLDATDEIIGRLI